MGLQKRLDQAAIALLSFELGLALTYLTTTLKRGEAIALLDFNGLRSLPSLIQAAHLLAIGSLCGLLLLKRQHMARPCSWFLPLALALLCFYGSVDELFKLHLMFDQFNWQFIYLGLLATIPLLSWRDLVWLWRTQRVTLRWIASGMGIFLLGGFGAERVKGSIAFEVSARMAPHTAFLAEIFRITVEEFAELMGETLILYAFASFTLSVLGPSN